jgi:hypothetical protein
MSSHEDDGEYYDCEGTFVAARDVLEESLNEVETSRRKPDASV